MENSPIAIESFSYSWLPDNFDQAQIIGKSKLADQEEIINFDFDVPIFSNCASFSLVHADELFSDGLIKPVFIEPLPKKLAASSSGKPKVVPSSSPGNCLHCQILGKWSKASQRIFKKCFGCFRPVFRRIQWSRKSIQVDDIGHRRAWESTRKSWNNSAQSSPQQSYPDSSIHEAVLHCKRSLGN
ncbi:hypothetical protein ACFE04_016295 [Oxalis oulophora]